MPLPEVEGGDLHLDRVAQQVDVERRRLAKLGEVDEEHVPVVEHALVLRDARDRRDDAALLPRVDRVVDVVVRALKVEALLLRLRLDDALERRRAAFGHAVEEDRARRLHRRAVVARRALPRAHARTAHARGERRRRGVCRTVACGSGPRRGAWAIWRDAPAGRRSATVATTWTRRPLEPLLRAAHTAKPHHAAGRVAAFDSDCGGHTEGGPRESRSSWRSNTWARAVPPPAAPRLPLPRRRPGAALGRSWTRSAAARSVASELEAATVATRGDAALKRRRQRLHAHAVVRLRPRASQLAGPPHRRRDPSRCQRARRRGA